MSLTPGRVGFGYLLAIALSAGVALLHLALSRFTDNRSLLPFVVAVLTAAWWGGLKPGLLATILCAVAAFFLLTYEESTSPTQIGPPLIMFPLVGLTISSLCEALHVARRRAELRQRELERALDERRLAEDAVREGQSLLQAILDHSSAVIFVKDRQGRHMLVNQELCKLFHLKQEEMLGKTVFDMYPGDVAEHLHQKDLKVLETKRAVIDEAKLPTPRGELTYLIVKFPVYSATGELYGIGGVATDITERKWAEEELRAADRRKDEFLAILSHELRNLLAPIRNAVQVMRLAGSAPNVVDQAGAIMDRQLKQMVRLIDDLLDLVRISRNRLELRKEPIELTTAVQHALETSRPLIATSGHELIVDLPAQPILLDADPTRLTQVFANLVNNAAKYTERQGTIWVTARRENGTAIVSVRDNGVGISADILPKMFDMFMQADRSLERSQGGLGIGLTLVRRLVELHGGTIEAHSDGPGHGSEFIVRLPVFSVFSKGTAKMPPEPADTLQPRRILVVDDNVDAAESLAMMLNIMGHEASTAYDGQGAIDKARTVAPEIVLLDLGMPGVDGCETARRIRLEPWGKSIMLVALTGWGQEEDRRRTTAAGFDHHVIKPVEIPHLQAILSSARNAPRA